MTPLTNLAETLPSILPFGLDLLVRATIVLAVVQLLLMALERRSAASRHLVVTIGLAAVVALPLLMISLPDTRLAVLPSGTAAESEIDEPVTPEALGSWKTGSDSASPENFSQVARVIASTGIADDRALDAATAILWIGDNWHVLALSGLTLIPLILTARMLIGMIAVWVVARRAESADEPWMARELALAARRLSVGSPIRMLLSDRINVPLVWGFFKPVLILPTSARNWTRDRFRVVVLHEVAHVRRLDVLSLMMGRFATALYWFHPLSWILERTGRRECERACDDLVLRAGARPSDYADHLLGIAAGEDLAESYASVTLAMARPSELEGRLLSILRAEGERTPVSGRTATIAAATALVMLLPIATLRLTARPVAQPVATEASAEAVVPATADAAATQVDLDVDAEREMRLAQLSETNADFELQRNQETTLVGNRSQKEKRYDSEGEKWYDQAYELHGQDRYDEAIAAFGKAIEHGYRVGTSMYNIGCGYAMKGDVENAVRWIDDAFENGFTRIATVEKDSDLDPIRSDPRFRGLLRDLRAEHGTSGRKDRFDEAVERYSALRASSSTSADKWADVGLDLLRLRQLDDAIHALNEAVRLAPDSSSLSQYNLACAYALNGDRSLALDALERSILAGFENGGKMMNDPDLESIRSDSRFATLRTMNDDLSLWAGMKSRQKRDAGWKWDQDAAFRDDLPRFEAVAAKYPDAGRAWFNLGYAALRAGNVERARTAFDRALALEFKRSTSMYNLACVEAIAGNRDAAFNWLSESEKAGGRLGEISGDEDLDNIRNDPRFEEFLERAMKRSAEDKRRKEELKAKDKKDAGWI